MLDLQTRIKVAEFDATTGRLSLTEALALAAEATKEADDFRQEFERSDNARSAELKVFDKLLSKYRKVAGEITTLSLKLDGWITWADDKSGTGEAADYEDLKAIEKDLGEITNGFDKLAETIDKTADDIEDAMTEAAG